MCPEVNREGFAEKLRTELGVAIQENWKPRRSPMNDGTKLQKFGIGRKIEAATVRQSETSAPARHLRQLCDFRGKSTLNNGEREFEPQCVAVSASALGRKSRTEPLFPCTSSRRRGAWSTPQQFFAGGFSLPLCCRFVAGLPSGNRQGYREELRV
jgi:hypothetical protein